MHRINLARPLRYSEDLDHVRATHGLLGPILDSHVGVDDDPEHLRRRPAGSPGSSQLGCRQLHRVVVLEDSSYAHLGVSDLIQHAGWPHGQGP